jgi:hypothetical protein
MPIVPCKDCGKPVSSTAAKCPACGRNRDSLKELWQREKWWIVGFLIVAAVVVLGWPWFRSRVLGL